MDSTVPWILAAVSMPIMLFKQWTNVIQIRAASGWLVEGDMKARREASQKGL